VTVVAALVTRQGAWIGSDSLSSDEMTCNIVSTPKIGWFGDKLIGYAGSWDGPRVLEIARRHPDLSWAEILFKAGPLEQGLSFICIEAGRLLFTLDKKETFVRAPRRGVAYGAIGSGEPHALGALYVSHAGKSSVLDALKAAAEHNPFVRGPFRVVGGSWR
jgi:hypothetical protein